MTAEPAVKFEPVDDETFDSRRRSARHATARSAAARDQRVPAAWKRYGG